jgi:hypothetical protein
MLTLLRQLHIVFIISVVTNSSYYGLKFDLDPQF